MVHHSPDPFWMLVLIDPRMVWMLSSIDVGLSSPARMNAIALRFLKSVGWWGGLCIF